MFFPRSGQDPFFGIVLSPTCLASGLHAVHGSNPSREDAGAVGGWAGGSHEPSFVMARIGLGCQQVHHLVGQITAVPASLIIDSREGHIAHSKSTDFICVFGHVPEKEDR